MAEQQSTNKVLLYTLRSGPFGGIESERVYGVKDPYSGKTYGEKTYKALSHGLNIARATTQGLLESLNHPLGMMGRFNGEFGGIGQPTKEEYAKKLAKSLSSMSIPKEEDYIQKDMMIASYDMHQEGWDSYFKGNYQNPRLTEERNNAIKRNGAKQTLSIPQGQAAQSSYKRTSTSTGLASVDASSSPFYYLESGLSI